MPNSRTVRFEIDPDTWENGTTPSESLVAAANLGQTTFDLDTALLFAGIWTRSPLQHGFSLSDCWAWLRYYAAFLPGASLRLRWEWTFIDPHQKMVASDDFGVGIGTCVLTRMLGFEHYADTLWVVNVLEPGRWRLEAKAKRGPKKSPDYIAYDTTGRISVLECKGTQSSRAELLRALGRGSPQKKSLKALGGQHIIQQLVVGTLVPQYETPASALVAVHDPAREDSRQELRKYTEEQIRQSTSTVAFAKELALFELDDTAATLIRVRDEPSLESAIAADTTRVSDGRRLITSDQIQIQRDLWWRHPVVRNGQEFKGIRFTGTLPAGVLESLRVNSQFDARDFSVSPRSRWSEETLPNGVRLQSPIGATYRIEWLE